MTSRHDELRSQFEAFDAAHPEVWEAFVRFTYERIERGYHTYSAKAIVERVRWELAVGPLFPQDFKINNNWPAFYARKFMAEFPAYDKFFRLRHQTSHDAPATNKSPLTPRDYQYGAAP